MTRKLSISLPDDVAEQLDHVENVSAYIADAIRMKNRREATLRMLQEHGHNITEEDLPRIRAKWGERLSRPRSPESIARSKAKWDALLAGEQA
jgi:hypothetical protein